MAERPLLNLPTPEKIQPKSSGGGGGKIVYPSRDRQRERIDPRFAALERVAASPGQILALRANPSAIAPERAIVFEVEGSLEDFYEQARNIGLEYLGDYEADLEPTEDFYSEKDPEKKLNSRVYLAMPTTRALQELLSLWRRYKTRTRMPNGKGEWSKLFGKLVDVRAWGPSDRVPEETRAYFSEELERDPDGIVRIEIELWFYTDPARRAAAQARLGVVLDNVGAEVVNSCIVPEINYHATLVDLPRAVVQDILNHPDVDLTRLDDIMFLRPQSVAGSPAIEVSPEAAAEDENAPLPAADLEPIVALLDGYPVQNHAKLRGRLRLDDPEGLEDIYPVAQRRHGTEMSSLIIHGDLNHREQPLGRPIYVRPILQPVEGGERTSPSNLLVDIIHTAVRRFKVGTVDEAPTAPDVFIVNLSIGDPYRPFARVMSPLARLLDYLSWTYKILFLVSAGNYLNAVRIEGYDSWYDFENANPDQRALAVFDSLNAQKSQRTLYSPAEAVNALTIGAAHCGSAYNGQFPAGRVDPFNLEDGPNIFSAMGLGYRRSIKPDILLSGGRVPVTMVATGGELWVNPVRTPRQYGLKAAAPSPQGDASYEDFTCATSAATALASRAAHLIFDALGDDTSNHQGLSSDELPLVVKALLVHGAKWGDSGRILEGHFGPRGNGSHLQRRDDITRLLGYGIPDINRVLDCTENRATLLGTGEIEPDSALLYRIPLPLDLDGVRALRGLTVTVAWLSPVNMRHQGYRMVAMDISSASDEKWWMAEDRDPYQPTDKAVLRGTILHEHRTGEAAKVFVDDGQILLRLGCRATAGSVAENVPYAIAISFEVAVEAGVPVYDQVKEQVEALINAVPVSVQT
jgi:hypothetical protein